MVSLHMGLRQTSNLEEPERFLRDLEKCWVLLLNGHPASGPDRILPPIPRAARGARDHRQLD